MFCRNADVVRLGGFDSSNDYVFDTYIIHPLFGINSTFANGLSPDLALVKLRNSALLSVSMDSDSKQYIKNNNPIKNDSIFYTILDLGNIILEKTVDICPEKNVIIV
jgi:hypothetical protein